jgi:outer membrane murein-binding lipoprotein Lpp
MLRRLGLILATAILTVLLLQGLTSAQSAANLQADIFQLRSQVNQLRAQVTQLSRQSPSTVRPGLSSKAPRSPTDPSDPQIIDRLAVLAIEAKDRLTALENRVSRLEKQPATSGQK